MEKEASLSELHNLFEHSDGNYDKILEFSNGTKYLKLRTISKGVRLKQIAQNYKINQTGKISEIFARIFGQLSENQIEDFIKKQYDVERILGKEKEEELYAELDQVATVDWGGVRNNQLEKSFVNNYVKKIQKFAEIKKIAQNDAARTTEGWIISNWYSFWANKIMENHIKDHPKVLPGIGDIAHIDFFWENIPFDLKTTKFAQGFIDFKRKQSKLGDEIQALTKFANEKGIDFNSELSNDELKSTLIKKISENHADFIDKQIYQTRKNILNDAMKDPSEFAIWNYENQGLDRFGDENRFFLILIDKNTTEESWKLKRQKGFITKKIKEFLDDGPSKHTMMHLPFTYGKKSYHANCCVLFIQDS